MLLHAVSIGSRVPQNNFTATIQSVFESSINLRLRGEDRLITILVSNSYDLPQGIRLDAKDISFESLAVDQHAICRGGILRFDSSPLIIDLRDASIWKAQIPNLDMNKLSARQARSLTWQALNRQQRLKQTDLVAEDLFHKEKGSLLTRKLNQPMLDLIAATKHFDVEGSSDASRKVIGLGPGVTPTGDDILLGHLAGLWSTIGDDKERFKFIESFGKSLMNVIVNTNEISRTYLYHAICGEFSSSMIKLLNTIGEDEMKEVQSAVKEAMRVGHSSGMDSVTGLLIGLTVWDDSSSSIDLTLE